jgi:hypothetical protein
VRLDCLYRVHRKSVENLEDAVPYPLCSIRRMAARMNDVLTCSGEVDMKTGFPSSILRKTGTRWFKKTPYCGPWQ